MSFSLQSVAFSGRSFREEKYLLVIFFSKLCYQNNLTLLKQSRLFPKFVPYWDASCQMLLKWKHKLVSLKFFYWTVHSSLQPASYVELYEQIFYSLNYSASLFVLFCQSYIVFSWFFSSGLFTLIQTSLLQMHIQTLRGRILETILSLRFFLFQYGIVYKLHLTGDNTSLAVYFRLLFCFICTWNMTETSSSPPAGYQITKSRSLRNFFLSNCSFRNWCLVLHKYDTETKLNSRIWFQIDAVTNKNRTNSKNRRLNS